MRLPKSRHPPRLPTVLKSICQETEDESLGEIGFGSSVLAWLCTFAFALVSYRE